VEITTLADILQVRLGSSGSNTPCSGAVRARRRWVHLSGSPSWRQIEIDRLGEPPANKIKYIASYGGLRLTFHQDGASMPSR
jgi:hypothetical protein